MATIRVNADAFLAQLRALRAQVDALIVAAGGEFIEEDEPSVACPKCGERERLEDTGVSKNPRLTCLRCGTSFRPPGVTPAAMEATHG